MPTITPANALFRAANNLTTAYPTTASPWTPSIKSYKYAKHKPRQPPMPQTYNEYKKLWQKLKGCAPKHQQTH